MLNFIPPVLYHRMRFFILFFIFCSEIISMESEETCRAYNYRDEEPYIPLKTFLQSLVPSQITPLDVLKELDVFGEELAQQIKSHDYFGVPVPVELTRKIVDYLPSGDVMNLRLVSRTWNDGFSPLWQTLICNIFEKLYQKTSETPISLNISGLRFWDQRPETTDHPFEGYIFPTPHKLFNKIYTRGPLHLLDEDSTYTMRKPAPFSEEKKREFLINIFEHSHFPHLKILSLQGNYRGTLSCVNDDILKIIGEKYPKLKVLSLDSPLITDEGIRYLNGLRDLEVLSLGYHTYEASVPRVAAIYPKVSDQSLIVFFRGQNLQGRQNLKYLDLSRLQITDQTIAIIVTYCPNIVFMNLSGCTKLSYRSLIYLSLLKNLKLLDIRGCPQLFNSERTLPNVTFVKDEESKFSPKKPLIIDGHELFVHKM